MDLPPPSQGRPPGGGGIHGGGGSKSGHVRRAGPDPASHYAEIGELGDGSDTTSHGSGSTGGSDRTDSPGLDRLDISPYETVYSGNIPKDISKSDLAAKLFNAMGTDRGYIKFNDTDGEERIYSLDSGSGRLTKSTGVGMSDNVHTITFGEKVKGKTPLLVTTTSRDTEPSTSKFELSGTSKKLTVTRDETFVDTSSMQVAEHEDGSEATIVYDDAAHLVDAAAAEAAARKREAVDDTYAKPGPRISGVAHSEAYHMGAADGDEGDPAAFAEDVTVNVRMAKKGGNVKNGGS